MARDYVRMMKLAIVATGLVLVPAAAHAQSAFTGVVKDTTGAVLPGVTVEAASPALIEKVRSVTADANGAYRIENLRPGMYSLTFTLPGFTTVKKEGIELTSNFIATINADLKVGGLEESVTVAGQSPVVDVQSTTKTQVLSRGAGSVWLITPTTRYSACPGSSASQGCVVGALVDPAMTVSSLSVPLAAPNTEFGDRINQLDFNISKMIKFGRASVQPKFDLFNALNVSPVYAVRTLNYGTTSYLQPQSILNGRVFQLGAIVKF